MESLLEGDAVHGHVLRGDIVCVSSRKQSICGVVDAIFGSEATVSSLPLLICSKIPTCMHDSVSSGRIQLKMLIKHAAAWMACHIATRACVCLLV